MQTVEDHHYESAYWAGRMIDMPDSRMAWDIAKEIASILKAERKALKLRNDALKEFRDYVQLRIDKAIKERSESPTGTTAHNILSGHLYELVHLIKHIDAKSLISKDKTL